METLGSLLSIILSCWARIMSRGAASKAPLPSSHNPLFSFMSALSRPLSPKLYVSICTLLRLSLLWRAPPPLLLLPIPSCSPDLPSPGKLVSIESDPPNRLVGWSQQHIHHTQDTLSAVEAYPPCFHCTNTHLEDLTAAPIPLPSLPALDHHMPPLANPHISNSTNLKYP